MFVILTSPSAISLKTMSEKRCLSNRIWWINFEKRSYFAVGPSPANLTALRGRLASRPARHVTDSAAQFRTEKEKNKVWLSIKFVAFRAGLYLKAEIDQSGVCAVKGEAANTATVSCHLVWNLKCHNHWLLLTPSNNLRCMRQEWPWHYVCDIHFDFKQQPYR